MKTMIYLLTLMSFLVSGCSNTDSALTENDFFETYSDTTATQKNYKILALGDSYTIGESVCETCNFPTQLKDSLEFRFKNKNQVKLKIVATTGWTTTNLINAIDNESLKNTYDLVTLLIGVNNQYQGKPFSIYENEFPQLVNTAIKHANGDKLNVIVVSIPDYAFTPFGEGNKLISEAIDKYNNFAKQYCSNNNITYLNITDITRKGLENPELVATDRLHPSTKAYTKFVEHLLPLVQEKLKD
ncbi:SGNH/GDSL hydrolase family protein [Tamlana sp. 62-3]|uniref:SGNH/GDSL hydrolase family protein n=2 Tax=Neotamlana sargassicola TaxID=2883125 RepID=A0A9X1I5Y3_9FLAO|nr:SGNH/GDSL hydrolase family protein [Tamlana sargassicola]MCB4807009.1 SGNH/GDSL hydrolase family protein [Tamlana sargassicola]